MTVTDSIEDDQFFCWDLTNFVNGLKTKRILIVFFLRFPQILIDDRRDVVIITTSRNIMSEIDDRTAAVKQEATSMFWHPALRSMDVNPTRSYRNR
ncbi:hypothetical protein HA402_009129 [Bradysia odoriphaga]|nr:hypothetical protein HA402_009129 [Bradysia odoriphaga]